MLLHQLMVGLLVLTVAQFCLVWLFLPSESVRPPAMLRLEDDVERLKAALANGAGRVRSIVAAEADESTEELPEGKPACTCETLPMWGVPTPVIKR